MDTFGRYQLQGKLGQGGMGVVYRAFDTVLERIVALKLVLTPEGLEPEMRERFFREARAAGHLSHKNIVTIYDLGEQDGKPYLAMEYLDGEDLQRRLARPEKMSLRRKLDIAIEICEGVEFAHANGIIHRDLKPANIYLTDNGAVKILDFGLARLMTSQMTQSNMLMGTLNYMAPEQVRGERADQRSDVFSVGVVLYELLGGRKAFEGDSVASTLYKILQEVPEPLWKIDASLPLEVATIVHRALAKLRDERYQDMGSLRKDLHAYRQHLVALGPVTPPPSEVTTSTGAIPHLTARRVSQPPPARQFGPAGIAAIAAGVIAVVFAVAWTLKSRPEDARAPEPAAAAATPAPNPATDARREVRQPTDAATAAGAHTLPDPAPAKKQPAAERTTPAPAIRGGATTAPSGPTAPVQARPEAQPPANREVAPAPAPVTAAAPPPPPVTTAAAAPVVTPTAQPTAPPPAPAAAQAPASAPSQPAQPVESAEERITELVAQYRAALEARSLDQLKRIWPSLGGSAENAIRQEFQHASRISVGTDDVHVAVTGATGRVTFVRRYNLVTVEGQRLQSTSRATMDVRRTGTNWVIESVRFSAQ